ncbi:unnamed protein product [Caenorhabditis sp. 36 PRJEB53466]|nr:unnamed protein product [Caenorhabditis sp. 36 PRJEB53466]
MPEGRPQNNAIPPVGRQPARTVRRRRPTNLPPDEAPRNEVRILRPSEVPRREPLPEYSEPRGRRIVPNDVSLEELGRMEPEAMRTVILPSFKLSAAQLTEAAAKSTGVFSIRSANFEDPADAAERAKANEKLKREMVWSQFVKRNEKFIGKRVHKCTLYPRKEAMKPLPKRLNPDDPIPESVTWDVVMEAPDDSIYQGGLFFIELTFDTAKVNDVPKVKFHTMMFHPSLGKNGDFDMRGLVGEWDASQDIVMIYSYLRSQMRNIRSTIQNMTMAEIEDTAQPNISRLAYENWEMFKRHANTFVKKMASGGIYYDFTAFGNMSGLYTPKYGWARPRSPVIDIVG